MIYLDNASTTKVHPDVVEAMLPYFTKDFGNASSIYSFSDRSRNAIKKTKAEIANVLSCNPEEIYFTSGGTEADNWALIGVAEANKSKGRHIITSVIEHHAVLSTCKYLESRGFEVTYVGVDSTGKILMDELLGAIRMDTILISVMFANNEIGTIQPVKQIGEIAHQHNILFHTDAVQIFGQREINVDELNIDLLSASGHKINAPKGIGFLYIKDSVKINPLIHGGQQQNGLRGGTENIPYIVGLGKAVELRNADYIAHYGEKMKQIRDYMAMRIAKEIPDVFFNGDITDRLESNLSITIEGIKGEELLMLLDARKICCSSGSACSSRSAEPSHVLKAIGLSDDLARSTIRISLSWLSTRDEANAFVFALANSVELLRELRSA